MTTAFLAGSSNGRKRSRGPIPSMARRCYPRSPPPSNASSCMPPHVAETCALWIVAAHAFDSFDIFPRLGITSPTPECGKTTLLTMIGRLVPRPLTREQRHRPLPSSAPSTCPSPTLLIDEADTFLHENNELRGILNSGHKREAAFVLRVVGEDHDPRQFTTWTPDGAGRHRRVARHAREPLACVFAWNAGSLAKRSSGCAGSATMRPSCACAG